MNPEYAVYKFREVALDCAVSREPLQRRLALALRKLSPVRDSCFPTPGLLDEWHTAIDKIRAAAEMEKSTPRVACSDEEALCLITKLLEILSELERVVAVSSWGDWLTPQEASALLKRWTVASLMDMRTRGIGPPYVKAGRTRSAPILYRRSDLLEWLNSLPRIVPNVREQARESGR